jgi:hypothetical protein
MKYRKLRIAWSVVWGLATVLLIVLWVRSYYRVESLISPIGRSRFLSFNTFPNRFVFGVIDESPSKTWAVISIPADEYIASFDRNIGEPPPVLAIQFGVINNDSIVVPCWFGLLFTTTLWALPWLPFRFSLRTMLIATTLVAVVLGLIVWLSR